MKKILILGMGNKFFGDDGVGIEISEKLKYKLHNVDEIKVEETNWGGFRIIDLLSGYDTAIVIDSITTGNQNSGSIQKYDYKELINSCRMISFHDINFATAVEFAKELNIPMPNEIFVYAIEINESNTFCEKLSAPVKGAVDKCVSQIYSDIKNLLELEVNYNEKYKNHEGIEC